MPKLTASKLDAMYRQAEQIDQPKIDRFISYGRLKNGDHFSQQQYSYLRNFRFYETRNPKVRLRIVQNHIARFVNTWVNAILSAAPDVEILPNNPQEECDRKAAQLHRSVKAHIVESTDFYSIQEQLVDDFITYGECILKMQFDPNIGPLVNGEIKPKIDESGQLVLDQNGQVSFIQERMPAGQIIFTQVDPENLLRDPAAKTWNETRWVCHRHTMDKTQLIKLIKSLYSDEQAQDIINQFKENDETVSVYRGSEDVFNADPDSKKVSVREFYWKPTADYPKGYYCMSTAGAKINEGELPGGIFPFEFLNFESNHGTPRGESRLKQLAPVQLEINRCISKMAEHQITLGDDKIVTTAGSKIAEIKKYEGVRHFQVSGGQVPTILQGRSGEQYLNYYLQQVVAFDTIAEMAQVSEEKLSGMDPFAIFFLSSKQKLRYAKHASKFERFLIRVWKKTLELHKFHVNPFAVIPMVGASEAINVEEYKSMTDIGFEIKVKTRTEDPESLIAKQFQLNQFLQYVGSNLDEADIGQIAKESPFLEKSDFSMRSIAKAERAQNMVLKLDKGKDMPISPADDPDYMLQRLDTRMSQADFDNITYRMPDGQVIPTEYIQGMYNQKRQEYMALIQQRLQQQMAEKAGQIPVTGALIPVQMYESKINKDGEITTKRVQLPNDTLEWVINMLKTQGMTDATLGQFAPQTQVELGQTISQESQQLNQELVMQQNINGVEGI